MEHFNVSTSILSTSDFWNVSDDSSQASIRGYVHCLLSVLGYFDDKTGFDVDRIMHQIKEIPYLKNTSFQRPIIEKCADKNVSDDPSDVWAFRGFRCLMDEIKNEQMEGREKSLLMQQNVFDLFFNL